MDDAGIRELTKDEARQLVATAVYDATKIIERLQSAGKLSGNGHHARQQLAEHAADELASRWIED